MSEGEQYASVGLGRWAHFFIALAILLISGCSSSRDQASGGASLQSLIYARAADAEQLDPIHTDLGESVKVIVNVFETLVTYHDETTELVPGLAEKWESSADGLVWTFQLRRGVKFHDGTLMNAAAVVATFERLIHETHPLLFQEARPYRSDFQNIRQVKAMGEDSVEFKLAEPSAVFLENLAMFPASIISPSALETKKLDFARQPVGTGPFRFERWQTDSQIVLTANPDYWQGTPKIEKVVFVVTPDNAVRAEQLRRGQAHVADELGPSEIASLEKAEGVVIQSQAGRNVSYLAFQLEKAPLDRHGVREAIALALDKKRLVAEAYLGFGQPAVSMTPPTIPGHAAMTDRSFNLAEARRRLEAEAAAGGFSLPLKLKLYVMQSARPYLPAPREAALFVRDALQPIGVELEIVVNKNSDHFLRLKEGEHDLALAGWSSDNNDPNNFLFNLLDPDCIGANNNSRYRSEKFHNLLAEARRELDRTRREALYRQAQECVFADVPVIPLVHTDVRIALRANVKGYQLHPSSLARLRLARFEALAP